MWWGSSLLIRGPGPLVGVDVTAGVATASLEDDGHVLRLLFESEGAQHPQARFNMDLSVDRDGNEYSLVCSLRERPAETFLPG